MQSLTTILRGLQGKPQLTTELYANSVLEALENKDLTIFESGTHEVELRSEAIIGELEGLKASAAVIEIDGGLTYKPRPCSGLTSYVEIKSVFEDVVAEGYKTVVFIISSPGGQAYQCFETATYIRNLANENDIYIITYVDGQADSGGYVLASIADEVITNPMSSIGSIGVVVALANDLPEALAKGNERIFITDKGEKTPFNEDGRIKQKVIDEIQVEVNKIGVLFDEHVNVHRHIPVEKIKAMNAKSFPADKALELALVDKIMEREEFNMYISDLLQETNKKESMKLEKELAVTTLEAQLEESKAQLSEMTKTNVELQGLVKDVLAERKNEQMSALTEQLEAYTFIEDKPAMVLLLSGLEGKDKATIMEAFEKSVESSAPEVSNENKDLFSRKGSQVESEESGDWASIAAKKLAAAKTSK